MSTETDQLEADIEATRHRLNDTIDELGHKLSPSEIIDETMAAVRGQAGRLVSTVTRQVRDNPVPMAMLLAAGVGLMLLNRSRAHTSGAIHQDYQRRSRALDEVFAQTKRYDQESEEGYELRLHEANARALGMAPGSGEGADAFRSRVRSAVRGVKDAVRRVGRVASSASHKAGEAAHRAQAGAGRIQQTATSFYDDNPLAAGAAMFALGALIGGATPLSEMERRTLSGVANTAKRQGATLMEKTAERIERRVDQVH